MVDKKIRYEMHENILRISRKFTILVEGKIKFLEKYKRPVEIVSRRNSFFSVEQTRHVFRMVKINFVRHIFLYEMCEVFKRNSISLNISKIYG